MKQNILFLLTDQWPHDFFSRYGLPAPTPNTDRLAAAGTVFSHAFTTCPLCSPARGTLLTSRWPCQTGMVDNPGGGYSLQDELDPGERTWIEGAAEAGYRVGYYGKWHLGVDGPIKRGAQRHSVSFEALTKPPYDPARDTYSYDDMARRYTEWAAEQITTGRPAFYGRARQPEQRNSAFRLAADACGFLDEADANGDAEPFFLTVSFPGPHFPHYLPERFADLAESLRVELPANLCDTFANKPSHHGKPWWPSMDTASFDDDEWRRVIAYSMAHITLVDEAIGRILDRLDASGAAANTTVVFCSDHGDTCGAHNRFDKGAYFYDEVWRIPLIVRRPGQTPARQDAFVSLIDLGRTFFELTGARPHPERPLLGRDLRPLFDGGSHPGFPDRVHGVYDLYNGMSFAVRAIRDRRFKYVWNPQEADELYDLAADPHELTNRIGDGTLRGEAERLRGELFEWLGTVGDDLPDRAAELPPAGTIVATGEMGP